MIDRDYCTSKRCEMSRKCGIFRGSLPETEWSDKLSSSFNHPEEQCVFFCEKNGPYGYLANLAKADPGIEERLGVDLRFLSLPCSKIPYEVARSLSEEGTRLGVSRPLYVYRSQKGRERIAVSSTASGWFAWTIDSGWGKRARWYGSPSELKRADAATMLEAKMSGWPG